MNSQKSIKLEQTAKNWKQLKCPSTEVYILMHWNTTQQLYEQTWLHFVTGISLGEKQCPIKKIKCRRAHNLENI